MFQKIDHVNISVNNVQESGAWYEKVFDFKKVEEGNNSRGSKYLIIENMDTAICMSEHADWSAPNLDASNQHQIWHFGFRITNEALWLAKIKEFNLTFTYQDMDYPRSKSWYVMDPNGYEIEISLLKSGEIMFPIGTNLAI